MIGQRPRPGFAESPGEFASALHAIEVPGPLPGELEPDGGLERFRDDVRAGLAAARLEADLHRRCAALLDRPVPALRARALVHNDLYPAHVLRAEDGRIRAVLDWGDAVIEDPSSDFAVAYFWGGEEFLRTAIDRYAGTIDPDVARAGGAYMAISHLTYGARTDKPACVRAGVEKPRRIA